MTSLSGFRAVLVCFGLLTVSAAFAAETTTQATLVRSSGTVMVNGQPVAQGASIPQGATVSTGANSEANVQTFDGAIATLKANTSVQLEKLSVTTDGSGTVTKQTAIVDLKSGDVVSTIDPAKKNINSYGVRTPKGVASARGTAFSVSVTANGMNIAATADSVSFTGPTGATFTIQAGMISVTNAAGAPQAPVTLANAIAANPAIATMIQQAVDTVATVVQNNLGGLSAASATTLASQVVAAASAAAPASASTFAAQVVTAMTATGSSTSGASTSGAIVAVVAAAVEAAPQAALQIAASSSAAAPAQSGVVAATVSAAAPSVASQVVATVAAATGQTTATVNAAVSNVSNSQVQSVVNQVTAVVAPIVSTTPAAPPVVPVDPTIVSPSR